MALQVIVLKAGIVNDWPHLKARGTVYYNDGVDDLPSKTITSSLHIHKNDYDPKRDDELLMVSLKEAIKVDLANTEEDIAENALSVADLKTKLTADSVNVGG